MCLDHDYGVSFDRNMAHADAHGCSVVHPDVHIIVSGGMTVQKSKSCSDEIWLVDHRAGVCSHNLCAIVSNWKADSAGLFSYVLVDRIVALQPLSDNKDDIIH